jgi:hypothetical protein
MNLRKAVHGHALVLWIFVVAPPRPNKLLRHLAVT